MSAEVADTDEQDGEPAEVEDGGAKKSQATMLVELALDLFNLGVSEGGEPYAVAKGGDNVAVAFRGGRSSLGSTLARHYFQRHSRAVTAAARTDALAVLEGMAREYDPEEPALRVGRDDHGHVVVDLADSRGWAVVLKAGSYETVDTSPVLFRRTNLTVPLPCPADELDAESLSILRNCLNVGDRDWQLLVGFMVAALIPEIPHPVLALFGEQGTGKSTAGRLIGSVIDPSSAPLRTAPRSDEQWALQAAGSWVVVLDNVSSVQPWLSDAICRAVTGDGWVRRTLYTNSDVSVLTFRRVVVLTSIDAGALRGDLAERLLPIELQRIEADARRTEREVLDLFDANHPRILGGLFGLTARVLEVLPGIHLDEMPRLADFARVLAALDEVTGWSSLSAFLGIGDDLAGDVVESDPVAIAVVALVNGLDDGSWSGTATELLQALEANERARSEDPERWRPAKEWPKAAQGLTGALKRAATALRAVGVNAEHGTTRSTRRTWFLTRCEKRREPSSSSSTSSKPVGSMAEPLDKPGADIVHIVQHEKGSSTSEPSNPNLMDELDDMDDRMHHLSADACPGCGGPPGSFNALCANCSRLAAEPTAEDDPMEAAF